MKNQRLYIFIEGYTATKLGVKQGTEAMNFSKGGRLNIIKIHDFLYNKATVYLERKYNRFLEAMKL